MRSLYIKETVFRLSVDWIITFLQEANMEVLGIPFSVNKYPGIETFM